MNLKPRQILGLAAIVVFGAGMIFRLTQPSEREIMERRLASLPRLEAPDANFPIPDLSRIDIPPPLSPPSDLRSGAELAAGPGAIPAPGLPNDPDAAMPGSQEAKDDLYCWAVLGKEFDARIKTDPPGAATPLLEASRRLESAGVAKLEAEGAANADNWASLTVSYAERARADHRRNTLRIPIADCIKRASSLSLR